MDAANTDEERAMKRREANKQRCRKNPGHPQFHKLEDIQPRFLPDGFQDQAIIDGIKVCWDLMVKIRTNFVSKGRPECYVNTVEAYLHSQYRGMECPQNGSGWVWNVSRGRPKERCPCKLTGTCQEVKWAAICVSTSNHVIYDDSEVKKATFKFCYDTTETDEVGHQVIFRNVEEDRCLVLCITHNVELVDKLEELICKRDQLLYSVNKKYLSQISTNRAAEDETKRMVVVISYPHGCNKLVSWGTLRSRDPDGFSTYNYKYDAGTCSGSSGGLVWPIGRWFLFQILVHQMAVGMPRQRHQNRSGMRPLTILELNSRLSRNQDSVYFDAITSDAYPEADSDEEPTAVTVQWLPTQLVSELGDLSCSKNRGHYDFHPVTSFYEHIPRQYRNEEMRDAIKSLAELTTHIRVEMVSHGRPDVYPRSHAEYAGEPYPFSNGKGGAVPRLGSGWVWDVIIFGHSIFDELCWCPPCTSSETHERNWAMVKIVTAAHVVFDTVEAEQAICRLWYDQEVDYDECPRLESLRVVHSDATSDICMMECAIHDIELAQRLKQLVDGREKALEKVESNCRHSGSGGMVVVVSHPHGKFKQVTLGQCVRYLENQSYVLQTCSIGYSTDTCPGSSGGVVWLVGSSKKGSYHLASHSRQLRDKINCSGGEFMVCRSPATWEGCHNSRWLQVTEVTQAFWDRLTSDLSPRFLAILFLKFCAKFAAPRC